MCLRSERDFWKPEKKVENSCLGTLEHRAFLKQFREDTKTTTTLGITKK